MTADGTGDYDGADFAFLRQHDPLPKENESDPDKWAVWVVPACHEEEEEGTPTPTDLDPPFCLGFSAGLLQLNHWGAAPDAEAGEGPTVQYEFEAIRQPGHATEAGGWGDFFVFHVENGELDVMWRTDTPDTNAYKITPGTYDHAYWAFTKPGTYVFHVQAKGHPNLAPGVGFNPIIEAETVTSEVRRYTFHVGDLTVNHDPIFEVTGSVAEKAAAGTNVGAPICVKDIDDDTGCFTLHGHGANNFTIMGGSTDADTCGTLTAVNRGTDDRLCAQIQVKEDACLNSHFYDLELEVSDRKDHESNPDPALHTHIDDSIAVAITSPRAYTLTATAEHPSTFQTANFDLVATWNGPADATFVWHEHPVPPTFGPNQAIAGSKRTGIGHHGRKRNVGVLGRGFVYGGRLQQDVLLQSANSHLALANKLAPRPTPQPVPRHRCLPAFGVGLPGLPFVLSVAERSRRTNEGPGWTAELLPLHPDMFRYLFISLLALVCATLGGTVAGPGTAQAQGSDIDLAVSIKVPASIAANANGSDPTITVTNSGSDTVLRSRSGN